MTALDTFRRRMAGINDLLVTMSVLNWDARVTMPAGGHATRGEQLATLATVIQERFVDDATLLVDRRGGGRALGRCPSRRRRPPPAVRAA